MTDWGRGADDGGAEPRGRYPLGQRLLTYALLPWWGPVAVGLVLAAVMLSVNLAVGVPFTMAAITGGGAIVAMTVVTEVIRYHHRKAVNEMYTRFRRGESLTKPDPPVRADIAAAKARAAPVLPVVVRPATLYRVSSAVTLTLFGLILVVGTAALVAHGSIGPALAFGGLTLLYVVLLLGVIRSAVVGYTDRLVVRSAISSTVIPRLSIDEIVLDTPRRSDLKGKGRAGAGRALFVELTDGSRLSLRATSASVPGNAKRLAANLEILASWLAATA